MHGRGLGVSHGVREALLDNPVERGLDVRGQTSAGRSADNYTKTGAFRYTLCKKLTRGKQTQIVDTVPIPDADGGRDVAVFLALVNVEYTEGDPELDVLPLAAMPIEPGAEIKELSALVRVKTGEGEWVVFDGVFDRGAALALITGCFVARYWMVDGYGGRAAGTATR